MRTTYTVSEDTFKNAIALSSFLAVYTYGGANITPGFAIGIALREFFERHPEAAAHRELIETHKK